MVTDESGPLVNSCSNEEVACLLVLNLQISSLYTFKVALCTGLQCSPDTSLGSSDSCVHRQVVGKLAETYGDGSKSLQGLLVQQNRNNIIIDPDSLPAFTRLQRGVILQRQAVPLAASFSEVLCHASPANTLHQVCDQNLESLTS